MEDNVARAGCALACSYSTAEEFEAEIIAKRRAAGAYAPKRSPWRVRFFGIAAGVALVAGLIVFFR